MLALDVYNSAGELVRRLYNGPSAVRPTGLTAALSAAPGLPIQLNVDGAGASGLPPGWDGLNDNGQAVSGGVYYFKLEVRDEFGDVSSLTAAASLVVAAAQSRLLVLNSAGEVVRNLPLDAYGAVVDFRCLDCERAAAGGLKLNLRAAGGASYGLTWDGTNDHGAPVDSGVYLLELVRGESGGSTTVKVVSVQVLQRPGDAAAVAASALLAPNPLPRGAGSLGLRCEAAPGLTVEAALYNLAGERVGTFQTGPDGWLWAPVQGLSGGIYLVELDVRGGGRTLARRGLKAALLR